MLRGRWLRFVGAGLALLTGGAATTYLMVRPTTVEGGAAPLVWPECQAEQLQVLILGTFHFAQAGDAFDIRSPDRQEELATLLDRLEEFAPARIAVEFAHAQARELDSLYQRYLALPYDSVGSRNEIQQIGFRLARRLGHDRVYAVDVPLNLWHDSIAVFDERWPDARSRLRGRWDARYADRNRETSGRRTLAEILATANRDSPPTNSELYARFLPLVEGEVYAGALKLRPWYDRNLRIVQNLFRISDPDDERLLLVIGWGHLRVLKQMLELTPQLCPVDPVDYLTRQSATAGGGSRAQDR